MPSGEIKGGQRSRSVTLYYDVLRTKLCVVIKDLLGFEHELVFLRPRVWVEHEHRKWRSTGKLIHCNVLTTDSMSPQQEPAHEDVGGQDAARRQQRH